MLRAFLLATLCLAPTKVFSQQLTAPGAEGYITFIASSSDFDVNGRHVLLAPSAKIELLRDAITTTVSPGSFHPFIGEVVTAWGSFDSRGIDLTATRIVIPSQSQSIKGAGIVDAILPSPTPTGLSLRADGYTILVPATVTVAYTAPLSSPSTNTWVTFRGTQRLDGVVVADQISLSPNNINHTEDELRTKREYDPAAVPAGSSQGTFSKAFHGTDYTKIPPFNDPVMQARITAIGEKLVPKFQRDLPVSDPTKINFRFQLVDQPKWHDAITLASGIILVPHQIVERMENDSQLATVLADNIATALEKQAFRQIPARKKMSFAALAGDATEVLLPGAFLIPMAANGAVSAHLSTLAEQQSGRVSLALLHDAGYEINEAPIAWWTISAAGHRWAGKTRSQRDLSQSPIPDRALYLYRILGTTWHTD